MAEKKAGVIVILSSPSGAGKTTLVKKISSSKKYKISISHTTRKPRANENKKLRYKIITIFILPPSKKELYRRLLKRDKKDKKIASDRMKQFKKDVLHWKDYDFAVINDDLEKCFKLIIRYINKQKKQKATLKYDKNIIKSHILKLIK